MRGRMITVTFILEKCFDFNEKLVLILPPWWWGWCPLFETDKIILMAMKKCCWTQ